jgi:hypothetical protein
MKGPVPYRGRGSFLYSKTRWRMARCAAIVHPTLFEQVSTLHMALLMKPLAAVNGLAK